MRFALVNGERIEAQPKLKGLCPGCAHPVNARCGTQRIKHWYHLPGRPCGDRWWEPETVWHRSWKNKFPGDWQEYRQQDQVGEWHIADVRTSHGLVIEFQHSHIDPKERATRERFYGNMVWVVDGARRKRDYKLFIKGMGTSRPTEIKGVFLLEHPEKWFPADWLESTKPIFFDFQNIAMIELQNKMHEALWCLFPERVNGNAIVAAMTHETFVAMAYSHSIPFQNPVLIHIEALKMRQRKLSEMAALASYLGYAQQPARRPYRRSRRL